MAQGMNLSRILRACHASRSLHGYIQVPQIHLPYHGNQGGAGVDLLTVGLKKNQQLACHDKNGPPQIGSPRNQFFDKYGPPGTYFTAKFGPPLELIMLRNMQ